MGGSRKKRPIEEDEDELELDESNSELALAGDLPGRRRMEAIGIAMMLGAVALCFALFSFDPNSNGDNLVGPLGEGLAKIILGGVGAVGYVAALMSVLGAGATLLGKLRFPSIITLLSAVAITVGATVLAHMLVEPDLLGHPAGGLAGVVISEAVASVAGPAGAALVAVGAVLIGVLGIADISIGRAMLDAYRAIRWVAIYLFGSARIYREAKQAGRTREIELIEAARSRRAMQKLEAEERERALRAELEEKARLAVLKATAKAEERALAKIAAQEAKERMEKEAALAKAPVEEVEVQEPLENPADVLEQIDRSSVRPKRLPAPVPVIHEKKTIEPTVDEEELDEEEDLDEEEGYEPDDEDEDEELDEEDALDDGDDEDEPETDEALSEGPMIHDRLTLDTNFDDDAIAAEEEPKKEFQLPPINLLDYEGDPPEPVNGELLRAKATRLEEKLRTYGVEGRVTAIRPGPVVTTYEYQPAPGVKVAKIANLCDDIAMSMEALRVRIVAPIPGRGVVGIELPNDTRENVYLKELIAHDRFKKSKSLLTLALGKDAEGNPVVRDLRKMPHLLVAGTTGSGKSVSINTMILSILYKATPDQVKFIMVDPKMLELSLYNDIPHLLLPVVTDPRKASLALAWAVDEMERRYQLLSDAKVRDIDGFNRRIEKLREQRELGIDDGEDEGSKKKNDPWHGRELPEPMPYIVVLIDEFADLMCVAPRDVESAVQRLAQKARAAGIHVLLATQRPSTDVITGVIKNNFPSRISFRVASRHDSATILNSPGAENLLGMGDSLVLDVASPVPERVHGGYVSENEVERVVDFWKAQARPKYDPDILKKRDEEEAEIDEGEMDEMYDMAVKIVTETKKASISAIQRRLRVGYNRAARMVEMMERQGIVGPAVGPKGEREVLVKAVEA